MTVKWFVAGAISNDALMPLAAIFGALAFAHDGVKFCFAGWKPEWRAEPPGPPRDRVCERRSAMRVAGASPASPTIVRSNLLPQIISRPGFGHRAGASHPCFLAGA